MVVSGSCFDACHGLSWEDCGASRTLRASSHAWRKIKHEKEHQPHAIYQALLRLVI